MTADAGQTAGRVRALGIDVGSTTVKIVGVDAWANLAWHLLEPANPAWKIRSPAFRVRRQETCEVSQTSEVWSIPLVATGYGRKLVRQAARQVTEITCHARGVYRSWRMADAGGHWRPG